MINHMSIHNMNRKCKKRENRLKERESLTIKNGILQYIIMISIRLFQHSFIYNTDAYIAIHVLDNRSLITSQLMSVTTNFHICFENHNSRVAYLVNASEPLTLSHGFLIRFCCCCLILTFSSKVIWSLNNDSTFKSSTKNEVNDFFSANNRPIYSDWMKEKFIVEALQRLYHAHHH